MPGVVQIYDSWPERERERERERVIALAHTHTHTQSNPIFVCTNTPRPPLHEHGWVDTYSLWFLLEPRAYKAKAIFFPQELVSQFMAGILVCSSNIET
jgi:hypothetical protein